MRTTDEKLSETRRINIFAFSLYSFLHIFLIGNRTSSIEPLISSVVTDSTSQPFPSVFRTNTQSLKKDQLWKLHLHFAIG